MITGADSSRENNGRVGRGMARHALTAPIAEQKEIEAAEADNAKVAFSNSSKNLSLAGWADG